MLSIFATNRRCDVKADQGPIGQSDRINENVVVERIAAQISRVQRSITILRDPIDHPRHDFGYGSRRGMAGVQFARSEMPNRATRYQPDAF
jgi:hypothetical protein